MSSSCEVQVAPRCECVPFESTVSELLFKQLTIISLECSSSDLTPVTLVAKANLRMDTS